MVSGVAATMGCTEKISLAAPPRIVTDDAEGKRHTIHVDCAAAHHGCVQERSEHTVQEHGGLAVTADAVGVHRVRVRRGIAKIEVLSEIGIRVATVEEDRPEYRIGGGVYQELV